MAFLDAPAINHTSHQNHITHQHGQRAGQADRSADAERFTVLVFERLVLGAAEGERVTTGGFSSKRLTRVRDVLSRYLDAGYVPGAVAVVARRGEVHVEAAGQLAFEGAGAGTAMAADTICRTGSMTKPIVAACAMTLVEDCTLRLDDPVDEFLPELADMRVLADPNGPLDETVPAKRPITLRDLLTFTLGTGVVPAAPGTIPIADALSALEGDDPEPPDEWIRRLGEVPLVCQPGERWMYHTAANVAGVLIARATGR